MRSGENVAKPGAHDLHCEPKLGASAKLRVWTTSPDQVLPPLAQITGRSSRLPLFDDSDLKRLKPDPKRTAPLTETDTAHTLTRYSDLNDQIGLQ